MEYWNRLYLQGGHVIQPIDISGEGYGNGQAVTIPSPNGWVYDPRPGFEEVSGGAWIVPLYPSQTDYQKANNLTGWVTIFDEGYDSCARYGGCSWVPLGVRYIVNGYGLNPSVTYQGNWISFGATGGTPGIGGISCGNNGSNSTCYESYAQSSSCTVQCTSGRYAYCYQTCTQSDILPSFNQPVTPAACP
jgi:hypothetical protein